ncbi:vacuolar sorting protein 26, putative [Entamoeba histolytica HM-1:IMSS-B]|uniref:Vacuolar sorting protein 26, putative n=5 Tax=Entamoeba histolytica TaxID=5759 RepID=C4M540_ENTH1|nr:vacuolar sorting protein 26, putative [Entamoeba histolytica HM-1:IMSS]EMH74895.1 vacuolar sorting protein 26, putative [Entamoeba histolytica HM-1:IMSS-B]EMS13051.1 vacuolar sorting protein 26, putative [Entamoeba histolytica HM-3:IMSS]ENY61692.1 vacuolar sorting protein 26, putative [Entamoeba histolytica HM-1:IMSS-A]GAT96523.1 vacuolar sorting protein 26 putative [Entamoeba histolytica]EAL46599.1 vacuolar sorting protein 26, putative [Entamoeba histolytica HM-1:IMSS]|eukprot:XP_651985.1 vacuolar sorting protein 26, putative [Entamoeba histolytica HM-1:IMSS]
MDVTIHLNKELSYPKTTLRNKNEKKTLITLSKNEKISGTVYISKPSKPFIHSGLQLLFIGTNHERGKVIQFHTQTSLLTPPGKIEDATNFPFNLTLNAPFDSYLSNNIQISYCLKAEFLKSSKISQIIQIPPIGIVDLFIKTYSSGIKGNPIVDEITQPNLKLKVEINSNVFDTKGIIKGKILFEEVNLENPIEQVNLVLIRKERFEQEVIETKVFTLEVMDGSPEDLITIPFNMFLKPLSLSPTTSSQINTFSLSYDLRMNLETEKKRLFKKWEVILFRKQDRKKKSSQKSHRPSHQPITLTQQSLSRSDSIESLNESLRESSTKNSLQLLQLVDNSSHSSLSQHTDFGIELGVSSKGDSSEDLL